MLQLEPEKKDKKKDIFGVEENVNGRSTLIGEDVR